MYSNRTQVAPIAIPFSARLGAYVSTVFVSALTFVVIIVLLITLADKQVAPGWEGVEYVLAVVYSVFYVRDIVHRIDSLRRRGL